MKKLNKILTKRNGTFFSRMLNPAVVTFAFLSLFVLVGLPASAWGPGNRPTFTIEKPAEYVTFNSITNNPAYGDERNFFKIREVNEPNSAYRDKVKLIPGKEYQGYIYFHNNASKTFNDAAHGQKGIAKNAKLMIKSVPVVKANKETMISAKITADNANPKAVWDEAYVSSDSDVSLNYVPGSAVVTSRGAVNGQKLGNDLFSSGALLGYDALNGALPGCNEFSGYVTYRFTVGQPNFTFKKEVSIKGQNNWTKKLKAKVGDELEYRLAYNNTGTVQQNNVSIFDKLPKGVNYLKTTAKLYNQNSPNGANVADELFSKGASIGSYQPGADAAIKYNAKITKDGLVCGSNVLKNTATVKTPDGNKTDFAEVEVEVECKPDECKPGIPEGDERCNDPKECKPGIPEGDERCNDAPTALPHAGPLSIAGSVLAVAAIVLGVTYYVKSKKHKNKLASNSGITLDEDKEAKFVKKENTTESVQKDESANSSEDDATPQE